MSGGEIGMAIYLGKVKNGVVVLGEGITLAEGSTVEVHVPATAAESVLAHLAATLAGMGVRVETKLPMTGASETMDRTPVETTRTPISRLVLEGRQ